LVVVPGMMPAAPRRCLGVVPRPQPATPVTEHLIFEVVVPRPMLAPIVLGRGAACNGFSHAELQRVLHLAFRKDIMHWVV
jgi:hypothetical protein